MHQRCGAQVLCDATIVPRRSCAARVIVRCAWCGTVRRRRRGEVRCGAVQCGAVQCGTGGAVRVWRRAHSRDGGGGGGGSGPGSLPALLSDRITLNPLIDALIKLGTELGLDRRGAVVSALVARLPLARRHGAVLWQWRARAGGWPTQRCWFYDTCRSQNSRPKTGAYIIYLLISEKVGPTKMRHHPPSCGRLVNPIPDFQFSYVL